MDMDMDMDANNLLELLIENKGWLDEMNDERGMYPCMASPVSQLFSFRLYCDIFEQREKCEVYGHINIEDVYGTTFEIYHVDSDDPAILTCEDNSLDIFFPCDCAASYIWARMLIRFFDRADGSPIVDSVLNFDRVDIGDFDRHKFQRVDGTNGHALVSFATFSKAIFALVGIKLVKNDKSNALQEPPCLNGRIVARYGNTYGEKYPGIMLFDDPPPESTRVEFDSPIELLREMVVVPAYSFLRIDIGLFDASTSKSLGNHKVEFLATLDNRYAWRNIEAGDFIIRVDLRWVHPYEEEQHSEKLCKRPKVCTYQQVPNISREPKCDPPGFSLLEVFAVMIGHNISSVLNISGNMKVKDYRTHRLVFNRKGSNPHILSSESKTIPIEGPTECISAPEGLVMTLDLCDVYNEVSIKGSVAWGFSSMDIPISWYNRRICSVCRGINGYAAIFYTLFCRAVQAHVEVSLLAKNNSLDARYHHVDGTILASYTNEDYSTKFEKTYYKSVLFNKTEEVKLGCRIPLLKSVVAVPVDASLIVEVDLNAKSIGEHWKHFVEIDIDDPDTNDTPSSKLIKGKNYDIQVSVVWSKLYKWTH